LIQNSTWQQESNYSLLSLNYSNSNHCSEWNKVVDTCSIEGSQDKWQIKEVKVINNGNLQRMFTGQMEILLDRLKREEFRGNLRDESDSSLRQSLMGHLNKLCLNVQKVWKGPAPNSTTARILPLWHGTSATALSSICSNGFAALQKTDTGYFGKGLYFTSSFDYAARVYGNTSQLIVLCLVCVGNVFPVIRSDMPKLTGGANYKNYDTHFVPVIPQNSADVNEVVYLPCDKDNQEPQYYEFVVFNSAQVLPQYVVSYSPKQVAPTTPTSPVTTPTSPIITLPSNVQTWTIDEVCGWFEKLSLSKNYTTLLKTNGVDGDILVNELKTADDMKEIGITSFGDIRKILRSNKIDK